MTSNEWNIVIQGILKSLDMSLPKALEPQTNDKQKLPLCYCVCCCGISCVYFVAFHVCLCFVVNFVFKKIIKNKKNVKKKKNKMKKNKK